MLPVAADNGKVKVIDHVDHRKHCDPFNRLGLVRRYSGAKLQDRAP